MSVLVLGREEREKKRKRERKRESVGGWRLTETFLFVLDRKEKGREEVYL